MFTDNYKFDSVNYSPYHSLQFASEFILNEREVDEIVAELNQTTGKDHSIFKKLWHQSNHANKPNSSCYIGYNFSFVNSNGDVFPCCGCKYTVGNLKQDSFTDIWNSETYPDF